MAVTINTAGQYTAPERRTTSDDIFDAIHSQICKMKLLPGAKLSEVEIAKQFDVSRQPVREAFIRLGNMGLLNIRPQRATIVRKISLKEVASARFIRLAIELEVCRKACAAFKDIHEPEFQDNLHLQQSAIKSGDVLAFGKLDIHFHKLFCKIADMPEVFKTIEEQKMKIDRLCSLSLANLQECEEVYADHEKLLEFIMEKNEQALIERLRSHLSRLDATIEKVSQTHAHYFE